MPKAPTTRNSRTDIFTMTEDNQGRQNEDDDDLVLEEIGLNNNRLVNRTNRFFLATLAVLVLVVAASVGALVSQENDSGDNRVGSTPGVSSPPVKLPPTRRPTRPSWSPVAG
jgi:hypothetical protein